MDKIDLLEELDKVENLPTLPIIVQQIQRLIASPNSTMAQISQVIAKDQAITARVVRLINSAFYGLGGKVTSIQQAIVLLGLNTVKNLITGVSVVKMFEDANHGASLFDREKFWIHSFACALGAQRIAKTTGQEKPEDFFLAGLLHDIGVLVLDQFFHEQFISVIQHSVATKTDYTMAEKNVLGVTHGEVGEFVALKWKIPPFLIHTIRHHHHPMVVDKECDSSLIAIATVHAADVASINRGFDIGYANGEKKYCDGMLKRINVHDDVVDEIFDSVEKDVNALIREWGL